MRNLPRCVRPVALQSFGLQNTTHLISFTCRLLNEFSRMMTDCSTATLSTCISALDCESRTNILPLVIRTGVLVLMRGQHHLLLSTDSSSPYPFGCQACKPAFFPHHTLPTYNRASTITPFQERLRLAWIDHLWRGSVGLSALAPSRELSGPCPNFFDHSVLRP